MLAHFSDTFLPCGASACVPEAIRRMYCATLPEGLTYASIEGVLMLAPVDKKQTMLLQAQCSRYEIRDGDTVIFETDIEKEAEQYQRNSLRGIWYITKEENAFITVGDSSLPASKMIVGPDVDKSSFALVRFAPEPLQSNLCFSYGCNSREFHFVQEPIDSLDVMKMITCRMLV